jgi:hypothetical protein
MPEFASRQVTALAGSATSPGKMRPSDAGGRVRTVVITSPATAAWAQNDTIGSGFKLPIGSRFLSASFVSHEAMGSSVTMDVGIRNFDSKVAIDADGIAAAVSVASAGRTSLNNGALVAAGVEYRTTEVAEVYATLTGANPTDNAQFRIEVHYVCDD